MMSQSTPTSSPQAGKKGKEMSYQFHRWIITLAAQVRALHGSLSHEETHKLDKEVETCEAQLQQLYSYAHQQDIDLMDYYHPFAEIEEHLLLLHRSLVSNPRDSKT